MFIDFLIEIFEKNRDREAIVWREQSYNYDWLLQRIQFWREKITKENVASGSVIILKADFSPNSVALFLALIEQACLIVPLSSSVLAKEEEYTDIAQGEVVITMEDNDDAQITALPKKADHELYVRLRNEQHPGLILFSSGSTGKSKAAVHDIAGLLKKFQTKRHDLRTLVFLLFDHIGGFDTLLYSLSNGSTVITVEDRSPQNICQAVEKHKVEVLPVTPTFLNLLILSEAYKEFDLSSLKYITYGTEVMPESTLKKCAELFPKVTILQKYGTTEVGTMRSKSKSSDSTWVKVGGEGYETRIVDGILHIKAQSAMLGYLNETSPFTEDGWFVTGDAVEEDGEYIKFLGRKSEIINVGGEKVYPAEVENVVQTMDNVAEVTVYGESNPIMGNIVCAKVALSGEEDKKAFSKRLTEYCKGKLENYKVPIKVEIVTDKLHSERFKKTKVLK